MHIRKAKHLEQAIQHAVDGKNVANARWVKAKSSKLYWCSKEYRLHGSECDVYQRDRRIVSCRDEYTGYQECAQG